MINNEQRLTSNEQRPDRSAPESRKDACTTRLLVARCSLLVERRPRRAAAFTLMELLVVISIIVILIAILLPVLGKIITTSHVTATEEQFSAIVSACSSYKSTFDAYPGPFSEADISNHHITGGGYTITGTQNMLIGLMGTLYVGAVPSGVTTITLSGSTSGGGTAYVTNPLGGGPINYGNNGLQMSAFFNPLAADLLPEPITATGTVPTLYDDFPDGLPVLYYRRTPGMPGATGYPVEPNYSSTAVGAAYYLGDNQIYTDGGTIGGATQTLTGKQGKLAPQNYGTQIQSAYFSGATAGPLTPVYALANTVDNQSLIPNYAPAYANTAGNAVQGSFVLISAGADHIYGYNNYSNGVPITTVPQSDDIVVFGGQ